MRTATCIAATGLLASITAWAFAQQGDGLLPDPSGGAWSRWQTRVTLGITPGAWRGDGAAFNASGNKLSGLSVLGDYYFASSAPATPLSASGGFRATSGLIVGARSTAYLINNGLGAVSARRAGQGALGAGLSSLLPNPDLGADSGSSPYVGVGYTGASVKGGWGFSADIGLMATSPGSVVKLGRVLGGVQRLDDTLREMRLSPLLQLGVSYSF